MRLHPHPLPINKIDFNKGLCHSFVNGGEYFGGGVGGAEVVSVEGGVEEAAADVLWFGGVEGEANGGHSRQ